MPVAAAGQFKNINQGQSAQAVGSSSGPTTVSASFADLTDMAVTLVTKGGNLECSFTGSFSHSGTSSNQLAFSLDAATEVGTVITTSPGAGVSVAVSMSWLFTNVAAGSHTVKVRWLTGGATWTATGTLRAIQVAELPT
jgi:hypothetical protein